MGYAKLLFKSGQQLSRCMFEIAGIVTGTITNLSSAASVQSGTLITSTDPLDNWTNVYPAAPSVTVDTARVLRSPFNGGANGFKTVQLINALQATVPTLASTTNVAGNGLYLRGCSSASAVNTLIDGTWYGTSTAISSPMLCTTIHVSWSRYHLVMAGEFSNGTTGGHFGWMGAFEHTNQPIHVNTGSQPWVFVYNSGGNNTLSNTFAPSGIQLYNAAGVFNLFNQNNGTFTGLATITGSAPNPAIDHSLFATNPVAGAGSMSKNSSGNPAMLLQPLYFHLMDIGHPYVYISPTAGAYRAARGIGSFGDTLTVGSTNYVYLPADPSGIYALVLKMQ